jgi:PBP1b-binding outer membrane lipoprotein LpoB
MMKKLAVLTVAAMFIGGCSEQAREEVSTSLDSAAGSIGRATEDALDTLGQKMENIGDDGDSNRRDTVVTRRDSL